jgi:hypothetical protein
MNIYLVLSLLRATLSVTSLPQLNEVWRCHDDNIAGPSPCRMDLSSCMLAPVAGRRMVSFWIRCHIQIKLTFLLSSDVLVTILW